MMLDMRLETAPTIECRNGCSIHCSMKWQTSFTLLFKTAPEFIKRVPRFTTECSRTEWFTYRTPFPGSVPRKNMSETRYRLASREKLNRRTVRRALSWRCYPPQSLSVWKFLRDVRATRLVYNHRDVRTSAPTRSGPRIPLLHSGRERPLYQHAAKLRARSGPTESLGGKEAAGKTRSQRPARMDRQHVARGPGAGISVAGGERRARLLQIPDAGRSHQTPPGRRHSHAAKDFALAPVSD